MILLSRRAKESIKTGLAMVIAYAIALQLGWEKPLWAGIAVAMISLDTAGASLNKAAMRMIGTLLAGAVALTFIALFPQDRWAMIFGLSLYLGLCVYMLTGNRLRYFWYVSAFVAVVIIIETSPADSLRAFQVTVARVEETGMGILVYSLISAFLWPQSSRRHLEEASRKLLAIQHDPFGYCRDLMGGTGAAADSRPQRMQAVALLGRVGAALNAAESDSYTVWELRRQWRRFHHEASALTETLERWRESFPEVQALTLSAYLPNLDAACDELEARVEEAEHILGGEAPSRPMQAIALGVDRDAVRTLPHFQRAAVAVIKTQLDRLETLSRALLDIACDLRGYAPGVAEPPPQETGQRGFAIDPDRFGAAVTVMATLWIGFLIWVYVDPPGHALFAFMATNWTMIAAMTRGNVASMTPGFLIGIGLGGVVYTLVMPHLSGFAQLGSLIFGVTFAAFYLFFPPHLRGVRAMVLAQLNILMAINNQQSYDFAAMANTSLAILLSLALAVATTGLWMSPRPEKAFLRLLERCFRHAEFLISRMSLDWEHEKGIAGRWKTALYRNDLLEIPAKLAALGQRIDYRVLPGTAPDQVQLFTTNLQAFAYRVKELPDSRDTPQADLLVRELLGDVRAWRLAVQEELRRWADDPDAAARQGLDAQDRLIARLARLEARMEETYAKVGEGELRAADYENFYRLLGSFRGLSESGVNFVRTAGAIDWGRWREARF